MFRDEKKPVAKATTINVLIAHGGIGDLVCSIPAILSLIKTQHWINPLIWVPDYMVDFTKHFLPASTSVRSYTDAKKKYKDNLVGVSTKWLPNRTAMRTHPVDYAFQCLLDKYPYDPSERVYPRIRPKEISLESFTLPERYVVIVATAAEIVKTMPIATMNQIITYVKSLGYTPVFVGQEKVDNGLSTKEVPKPTADFSKGLNLVNKTDLLQLAAIMDRSKAVIGMDGGPIHIAGFSKAPIVAGYTFASPDHLMPIRDYGITYPVVPDASLKCKFCQSNWSLMYGHDFRNCYYEDFLCTKQMTFEKFKEQIDKIL